MDWYFVIYITAILVGFAVYVKSGTSKKVTPVAPQSLSPQYTYNELLAVIHHMVDEEYEREKLLMEIKENAFINDIQSDSIKIAQAVVAGLSPDFWNQMRRFHTDEYTTQYIGRLAMKYLYTHTVQNRPGIV